MSSLVTFHPAVLEKKSFEEVVDDARTDGRTDARTHDDERRTKECPSSYFKGYQYQICSDFQKNNTC